MSETIADAEVQAGAEIQPVRERRRLRALARSGSFVTGMIILVFWLVCALFGQHLVPVDPYADDLMNALAPPSAEHWFGTDQLGRDVFARVIVGSQSILAVAPLATLLAVVLGTGAGLVAGYVGGLLDDVLSRIIDAFLAVPVVILAILVLVALGKSDATIITVVGLAFAPIIARTVRAAVLAEMSLDYVAAASLRRETALHVMLVELLPNILGPILVEATVRLGYAIFTVASLSFLGFGIQPPSADWGLAISENYGLIGGGYWWTVLFDAMATASLVVGVHLAADGLRQVLTE